MRRSDGANIIKVVSDFDGIFSPSYFGYTSEGKTLKLFSVNDSLMLELMNHINMDLPEGSPRIDFTIVSGNANNDCTLRRVEDLRKKYPMLELLEVDNSTKMAYINKCLEEFNTVFYIGDDIFDAPIFNVNGVRGHTTANAPAIVTKRAVYTSNFKSGESSFTDIMGYILRNVGFNLDELIDHYVEIMSEGTLEPHSGVNCKGYHIKR